MYIIYRPIEGISLNGNEYLEDTEGNIMKFDAYEDAFNYLVPFYKTTKHLQESLDNGGINIGEESEVL